MFKRSRCSGMAALGSQAADTSWRAQPHSLAEARQAKKKFLPYSSAQEIRIGSNGDATAEINILEYTQEKLRRIKAQDKGRKGPF